MESDPDPDPLVRSTDPRIQISTKLSRIPNAAMIMIMKILKALYQNSRLVLFQPGVGSVLRQAVRSPPTRPPFPLILLGITGGLILLLAGAGA
jgi:hypothetical protein